MEKYCSGCERYLDTSLFYKDRTKSDGLTTVCKNCRKKNQKKYRKNNVILVDEYERKRRHTIDRKQYLMEYQRQSRHYNKIRVDKYDIKSKARKIINDLIATNKLKKATKCEIMPDDTNNVQYHHQNYDYPYVVIALSHNVHEIVHKEDIYNLEKHILIRKIVKLICDKRIIFFNEHSLKEYLDAFNNGKI